MNHILVWQLAVRYLRGKRAGNAVPILSRISMVAIAVGSCAMIVLFSVFNGFEFLVRDLYKAFYPEIKITAAKGKFFSVNDSQYAGIRQIKEVAALTTVLEDNVLLRSEDEQKVATLKGIDRNYFTVNNVKPYIKEGADSVSDGQAPTAIAGTQLLNQMGMDINNAFSSMMLYYPNAGSSNLSLSPQDAFQSLVLRPVGAFRIQDDFDSKYILASLTVVQQLLQAPGKYSSIELKLKEGANINNVKKQLQQRLGGTFRIETRYEQNKTLYMVMRSEKWVMFAILVLVLLIASFNMTGALSLLVLEKRKDMAILKAMGAEAATVRNIFITEGVLWALTGGSIGLFAGFLLCIGQRHFQWIKMEGSYIIDAYPVHMLGTDFLLIIITVAIVGLLAAWFPAARANRATAPSLRSN